MVPEEKTVKQMVTFSWTPPKRGKNRSIAPITTEFQELVYNQDTLSNEIQKMLNGLDGLPEGHNKDRGKNGKKRKPKKNANRNVNRKCAACNVEVTPKQLNVARVFCPKCPQVYKEGPKQGLTKPRLNYHYSCMEKGCKCPDCKSFVFTTNTIAKKGYCAQVI